MVHSTVYRQRLYSGKETRIIKSYKIIEKTQVVFLKSLLGITLRRNTK
jgi:hypothetical protein